jgi:hypothetical protein
MKLTRSSEAVLILGETELELSSVKISMSHQEHELMLPELSNTAGTFEMEGNFRLAEPEHQRLLRSLRRPQIYRRKPGRLRRVVLSDWSLLARQCKELVATDEPKARPGQDTLDEDSVFALLDSYGGFSGNAVAAVYGWAAAGGKGVSLERLAHIAQLAFMRKEFVRRDWVRYAEAMGFDEDKVL